MHAGSEFQMNKKFSIFFHYLDHYWGLSSGWNYSPIYCSETTKKVMLIRFPNIKNVVFTNN